MPILYEGLLVSSSRNMENNAASEIYYTLTKELDYGPVKSKRTGISGLVAVKILNENLVDIMDRLRALEDEQSYFIHCLKIRPIQFLITAELDDLRECVRTNMDSIKGSFKIEVQKRHTPLRSAQVIDAIAPLVDIPVDLTNPETVILVEILGDKMGVSIIPPSAIYSCSKANIEEKPAENWFLS